MGSERSSYHIVQWVQTIGIDFKSKFEGGGVGEMNLKIHVGYKRICKVYYSDLTLCLTSKI